MGFLKKNIGKITDLCTFYAPSSDLCSEPQIYVWVAVLCFAKLARFGKLSRFRTFCRSMHPTHIFAHICFDIAELRKEFFRKKCVVGEGRVVVRRGGALLEMVHRAKCENRKQAVYPLSIQF